MANGGKPGGSGFTPGNSNGAADDGRKAATTDRTGINSHTADDHRVEVNNRVCHTENDAYVEVKGSKGEIKVGGFLEFIGGLKHSMTALFKTALDASYSKTYDIGPYSTEMLAAKYEILARKEEKVFGKKSDTYTGFKYEKNNGAWTEATAAKKKKAQALEKEINDAMTQRVGALIEETAARHRAKADSLKEKCNKMDLKIASQLRLKCETARMVANELDRHISNIQYQCGKFERQCNAMEEAASALMEIGGSEVKSKSAMLKISAGILKFTGSVVKLGE